MTVRLGQGIKPSKGEQLVTSFEPVLRPGEELLLVIKSSNFGFTHAAITTERAICFSPAKTLASKFPAELALDDRFSLRLDFEKRSAELAGSVGKPTRLKMLHPDDMTLLWETLRAVQSSGVAIVLDQPEEIERRRAAGTRLEQKKAELQRRIDQKGGATTEHPDWPDTQVVGGSLSQKAGAAVREQCFDGDPWMILVSAGGAGLLAAWDDRLAIIKTGALTSMMAGSFGGQRSATFHFSDVTGIEYNSGLVAGVLEILTPSYSGTSNKDFWRGAGSSRNANADDPWTLSNTLPLNKSEYRSAQAAILELRRRVSQAKSPAAAPPPPAPVPAQESSGLAETLAKLAALHDAGALSDEEFAQAKQRVIGSTP